MKKKLLSVILAVSMVASLTACGSSNATTEADTTETETTEETETEEPAEEATEEAEPEAAADAGEVKVGLVTDVGGVNDGSFNQSAWEGLQKASEDLGIEVSYLESATDADYEPNIENFVDDEYDLIICVGYMLADACKAAAEENPDQKFAIIDDATNADLPNVTCLMFEQAQASYLVGYVAGLTTESNTVGFVLGMSTDTMNQFGYGYCAGVLDANADAKILQMNVNAFNDAATGKSDANSMITNGADVIFHAAGGSGLGVIEACDEANSETSPVWAIGVDSDQSGLAPNTIITSAMKRVDNACYDVAEAILNGTLESGVITYDLSQGGVDIAATTDNLSEDVVTAVNDVKAKIISGEVTVPATKEDFEAVYGDVYELDE